MLSIRAAFSMKAGNEGLLDLLKRWYDRFSRGNVKVLRLFQSIVSWLYVDSIPASYLLNILESDSDRAMQLRPLIVALRLELGEEVRAPTEILEVAADIRKQTDELRRLYKRSNKPYQRR